MDAAANKRIGETIRRTRVLRGLSQSHIGSALGYHQSKISRLEQGDGVNDSDLMLKICSLLDIPPTRLGLPPQPAHPDAPSPPATSLPSPSGQMGPEDRLSSHPDLIRAIQPGVMPSTEAESADFNSLRARTLRARRLYHECQYLELGRTLPSLISELRHLGPHTPHPAATAGLLATTYQTAVGLLLKHGDIGNAWLATGRAMAEAERSGDPAILAASVRGHAHVLLRQHPAEAVVTVRHTADELAGSYDKRSPRYLTAFGMLLLRGAIAAARNQDPDTSQEFLTEASDVAAYVAIDRPDTWATFSPTNVALHQLAVEVSFGDAGKALRTAGPLMRRPIPTPERRAALWIDVGRAYLQQNRLTDAYHALRMAEASAPQDVQRPEVRALITDLTIRDHRRAIPGLHELAARVGANP